MNIYQAIQCKAMLAIEKPDNQAFFRSIARWYSKTFFTPLHQVRSLPFLDVLETYYEEAFDQMEDAERAERIDILVDPEHHKQVEEQAERAGEELMEQLNKQVAKDAVPGKSILKPPRSRLPTRATANDKAETVIDMEFKDGNLMDEATLNSDPLAGLMKK